MKTIRKNIESEKYIGWVEFNKLSFKENLSVQREILESVDAIQKMNKSDSNKLAYFDLAEGTFDVIIKHMRSCEVNFKENDEEDLIEDVDDLCNACLDDPTLFTVIASLLAGKRIAKRAESSETKSDL